MEMLMTFGSVSEGPSNVYDPVCCKGSRQKNPDILRSGLM